MNPIEQFFRSVPITTWRRVGRRLARMSEAQREQFRREVVALIAAKPIRSDRPKPRMR